MAETRTAMPRTALAVGLAAVVGAALIALAQRERGPEAEIAVLPGDGASSATARGTAQGTARATASGPASVAAAVGSGEPAVGSGEPAAPETEVAAASESAEPSFDVVRVSPQGAALVAGRAAPGSTVTVRAGEAPVAEVEAGPTGEFVAIFRAPPSATPQALSLESDGRSGGAVSRETVLLLPPAPPAPPTLPETARAEGEGWVVAAGTAGTDGGPGAAAGEPEPEVAATAILGEDGVEVIDARPRPEAPRRVSLASISYGEQGLVTLAGFGTAGSEVRIYVDDAHAVDGEIDAGGRWRLPLGEISAGVYRLRVDEIGPNGQVASRVETPFKRDFPELAPAIRDGEGAITVQPGHNLWTIAREHYGQGILYTQIFTANAGLIRDPELIYPGQIFLLPVMEGAGASRPAEVPLARP
jgi:nucleoid-associated protein YgaU